MWKMKSAAQKLQKQGFRFDCIINEKAFYVKQEVGKPEKIATVNFAGKVEILK